MSDRTVARPSSVKFLDLRRQYESIKAEIDEAIRGVLADATFIGGPRVREFERAFADYQQVAYCVGVANGTDAVEIALEALGLPAGSEVLVPANSFIASSEAVTRSGHRVRFADVDPDLLTVTRATLTAVATPATRAVLPVHLYGLPAPMTEIMALARERGWKVIEDAAQAHGAEVDGRRVGGFGDVATFSFYPGKNLGAYGDGGAITTQDEALALKCRMIANHGRVEKYDHVFEGRNSRLDALQAAILQVKLRHLEGWIERRREIAAQYRAVLANVGDIRFQVAPERARHVYHLFVIRTSQRNGLREYLGSHGIESGIHYPIALPKLGAYARLAMADAPLAANRFDEQLLSLPIGEHMEPSDAERVIEQVRQFFSQRDGVSTWA